MVEGVYFLDLRGVACVSQGEVSVKYPNGHVQLTYERRIEKRMRMKNLSI